MEKNAYLLFFVLKKGHILKKILEIKMLLVYLDYFRKNGIDKYLKPNVLKWIKEVG